MESSVSPLRAQLVIGRRTLRNGHLIGRPSQHNTGLSPCLLRTLVSLEQPGDEFSSEGNSATIEIPVPPTE